MKGKIICGIYKITSPTNKVYVGQSVNCVIRKRRYSKSLGRGQIKLYRSILKHGWDKHKFEIIHRCEESELNNLEAYYIELYNCLSIYGLNLKGGGANGRYSEESKKRMALAQTGKKRTEEHCKNISLANMGRQNSQEALAKFKLTRTGHVVTQETRAILAEASRGNKNCVGRVASEETRRKISIAVSGRKYKGSEKQRNICRIILNTQTGIFYIGVKEAANSISMNYKTLKCKLLHSRGIKNNTPLIYV